MDACRAMAAQMGSMWAKMLDLTLPIMSIFSGRGFNRGIRKSFGNTRIQDLVIKFFCVSVDLQKRKLLVHTKGLLWKYLRASMSLTGYLPPLSDNGALLVDGGYLNVCPADVMREQFGAKTVISVDVSDEFECDYADYGLHLSGWWLLWNSWNPFVKTVKVPSWVRFKLSSCEYCISISLIRVVLLFGNREISSQWRSGCHQIYTEKQPYCPIQICFSSLQLKIMVHWTMTNSMS